MTMVVTLVDWVHQAHNKNLHAYPSVRFLDYSTTIKVDAIVVNCKI